MQNLAIKIRSANQWWKIMKLLKENGVYHPRVNKIDYNSEVYVTVIDDNFKFADIDFVKENKLPIIVYPKTKAKKVNKSIELSNYPLLKAKCGDMETFFKLIGRKSVKQTYRFKFLKDYMQGIENILSLK